MSDFQSFVEKQPEQLQTLISYYSEMLISMELNIKIRYKIPFFDLYSWICYINPIKDQGIELAFLHGQELSDEHQILLKNNRKQIAGVYLNTRKSIPDNWIKDLVAEALVLDEYKHHQKKRTK